MHPSRSWPVLATSGGIWAVAIVALLLLQVLLAVAVAVVAHNVSP